MQKLFLLFLFLPLFGQAQTDNELQLSTELDESRMGLWEQGNYKVYVEMNELEVRYRQTGNSFLAAIKNNGFPDSTNNYYQLTADRFLLAANQLKSAENGFDLRKLIVYHGPDDEKQNAGACYTVEFDVNSLLERGQAVVYYKGNRVYTLKHHSEVQGEGLNYGTNTIIYSEDVKDYIFQYYRSYGW